jgi:hypothetical protein
MGGLQMKMNVTPFRKTCFYGVFVLLRVQAMQCDPVPLLWLPIVTTLQSLLSLGVVISVASSMPTGTLTVEEEGTKIEFDFDYMLGLGASWGIFIGATACSFVISVMTFMSYHTMCKEKKREAQDREVSSQYPDHSVAGYSIMSTPIHSAAQQPYSSYPPPQPQPYGGSVGAYGGSVGAYPPARPASMGVATPSPHSAYPSTEYAPPPPGATR